MAFDIAKTNGFSGTLARAAEKVFGNVSYRLDQGNDLSILFKPTNDGNYAIIAGGVSGGHMREDDRYVTTKYNLGVWPKKALENLKDFVGEHGQPQFKVPHIGTYAHPYLSPRQKYENAVAVAKQLVQATGSVPVVKGEGVKDNLGNRVVHAAVYPESQLPEMDVADMLVETSGKTVTFYGDRRAFETHLFNYDSYRQRPALDYEAVAETAALNHATYRSGLRQLQRVLRESRTSKMGPALDLTKRQTR